MAEQALDRLLQQTTFTRDELLNIQSNFKKLSSAVEDDGVIDRQEFQQMMSTQGDSVFVDALFRMFDRDNNGSVDFDEFVISLAIYQSKAKNVNEREKQRLFFKIFDVDMDDEISPKDLQTVLTSCFTSNFMTVAESDIQELVRATMARYELTPKGTISFDSYVKSAFQHRSGYMM
eukprot:PhF_6_TR24270/c0_g1_i1/m.33723/K06268/PPP3R, CNB; serine/threonine-protein phosphatase 2B regulatory subunit